MIKRTVGLLVTIAIALTFAGCAATRPPSPNLPTVPTAFRETDPRPGTNPTATQPSAGWWKVFADPVLDGLIERATSGNTSIQQAAARLAQARAAASAAGAARMPQAGVNASTSRQGGPLINAAGGGGTLINIGANFSYEVDLFGKLSKTAQAALYDVQSREALLRSARLLMQAEIAQDYLSLRALDEERALVRATAVAHRESLQLVERRQRAGLAPEQEVVRVRAEASATDADAFALDRRRAELEHALGFLTGDAASSFQIVANQWNSTLPAIPPGIPSALLARRPDISAAQFAAQATQTRLNIAQTAWFPNLSLTSSGGYASSALGDLLRASARSWGLGALLALPIFDGGRRKAGIQSASADLELAYASYREQILVAFRDVEDQLSGLRLLANQGNALHDAVDAASRATELSESRYRSGFVSHLEVLDARRTELRNRRAALQVQSSRYLATVGLVRALGGGWGTGQTNGGRYY